MIISEEKYRVVMDADFETILKSVGFNGTPRESVTILDMIKCHERIQFKKNFQLSSYISNKC